MLWQVLEVASLQLLQIHQQNCDYPWTQQFVQSVVTKDRRMWTDFRRTTERNSPACGKWGWEVALHTCRLTWLGGISVLLSLQSKPDSEAWSILQFFSSVFPNWITHQAAIHSGVDDLRSSAAPPANVLSSYSASGEQAGSYLLLPLAAGITYGGAKSRMKWEDFLPYVADSPNNLALYLKKHKALNCNVILMFLNKISLEMK